MNGYVAAGYGITFGVLAAYSGWVIRRGRALRRALRPAPPSRPSERR